MATNTVPAHEVRKLYRWARENLPPEQRGPFEAQLIQHLFHLATKGAIEIVEEAYGDDR